jgi:paraquat-inducible protein A
MALTTICAPFIKIMGTLIVLFVVQTRLRPRWVNFLYALLKHLNPWIMVEVYLLGFLVAYSRVQSVGIATPELAVVGLIGLMISMAAMDATIDPQTIWEKLNNQPNEPKAAQGYVIGCDTCFFINSATNVICSRCGDPIRHRKPNSLTRTAALLLAAVIFYIPSNVFPVISVTRFGRTTSYTIYGGLKELATSGLWPLALIVFIASMAIPLFKIASLSYLLLQTRSRSIRSLRARTGLYRIIELIGRWSMVDAFVVSVLVALVRFGWVATITAQVGIIYFTAVVILTLLATQTFDPRLMWDAASESSSQ